MRIHPGKYVVWLALFWTAIACYGQPYVLMSMTNYTWKYNQSGANLGTSWREVGYDDNLTGWQTGFGVFAIEFDSFILQQTRTSLSFSNANTQHLITFYFRTHFVLTNDPYKVNIYLTNLVDDGAVFYINGVEFYRQGMPPAPAPINFNTFSAATVGDARYVTHIIPYDLLVQGDNLITVEVHEVNLTSSDVVFGLAATVREPAVIPLVITNQPSNAVVIDGKSITFSAGVSGFPISQAQWFLDGIAIPGATRLTYTISNVDLSYAGAYTLMVSNSAGAAVSAPAVLTVIADTNGPSVMAADWIEATNLIIRFSEALLPSTATNLANYRITNIASGSLSAPTRAVLDGSGTNVRLSTDPRNEPGNYLLIVDGVRDASPRTNLITANTMVPISTPVTLLDEYSFYYFYNPFLFSNPPGPGDDNPDLGDFWRQPDYVVNEVTNNFWADNEWDRGIFYGGTSVVPGEKGTELSSSMAPVVYFRTQVDFRGSPLGADLSLSYLLGDGGVLYRDGEEVLRFNMASGTVNWSTRTTNAADLNWKAASNPSASWIRHGNNVICAELHAVTTPQTSMAFALRLGGRYASLATGPVVITSQPTSRVTLERTLADFSFVAAGPAWFQWYRNGVPIAGATNPVYRIASTTLEMNGEQYSVLAWNETSSAMSSNAWLIVEKDLTPPALLSAYAISSNQILARFSKPLDPASTTSLANYTITNGVGPSLLVTSAILTNGTNVLLEVGSGSGTKPYVLVVNNLKDTSSTGNVISTNNAVTVGIEVAIPIDSVWSYDVSGTDLGTAWRGNAYNDVSWPMGAGLLYHEDAALPAPKSTELPLTSVSGQYIITYYFRQSFLLPAGATNATANLRHVIDDGAVLYMNGTEFHRFNMPAGPVASTTSAGSVGDAAYAGPFINSLPGLTSGSNLLAAELHQSGSASSDMCFGLEMKISAPSVVVPVVIPPKVSITLTKTGGQTRLNWTGSGFTLQRATSLNGTNTVWQDLTGANSPYLLVPSNSAGFFRLKQ